MFFLRRFGCQICRWTTVEVSKLEKDLRANGVALVGISPEETGLKEFQDGGFFKGGEIQLCVSRWWKHGASLNLVNNFVTSGLIRLLSLMFYCPVIMVTQAQFAFITGVIKFFTSFLLYVEWWHAWDILVWCVYFLPQEIYIDEKKQCYKDLGFKRYGNWNIWHVKYSSYFNC